MKKLSTKILLGFMTFVASIGVSMAAVDAAVTTALTDAGTDAATVGGAILLVLVAIAAFKYIRRAL